MSKISAILKAGPSQPGQQGPDPQAVRKLAITNVRVFDGKDVVENQTVIIDQEGAAAEGDATQVIDAAGMTLLPGLIDAHVHIAGPNVHEEEATQESIALLTRMAKCGITTALDMGYMPKAHLDSLRGHAGLTDLRFAGNFATSTGSLHSRMLMASAESIVDSADAAVRFVQNRIAEEADYIKIVADVPGPTQEVINALASEAARHGKISVAHAARHEAFEMAQDGNVTIITHVPLDTPVGDATATRMVRDGRACVPTLVMMNAISKAAVRPGLNYAAAESSVEQLHRAGVPIIAGTDSNKSVMAPVRHGEDYFVELDLLSEAGLTNIEVLRAATSLPAKHFKLDDRGAIKEGKRADLVLVEGNPLENLKALRNLKKVWIAGNEVDLADA